MSVNRTNIGLRAANRGLIYEGFHASLNDALGTAIKTSIDLTGIDLSHQNLRGINLDGINLHNANFSNSDLSNANMSEANFRNCNFSEASLFDACFCYSTITDCRFLNTRFGMTDFSKAELMSCAFSGLSTFHLDFHAMATMKANSFQHSDRILNMSLPPYILQGFKYPIIFLDDRILIDGEVHDYEAEGLFELNDRFLLQLLSRQGSCVS